MSNIFDDPSFVSQLQEAREIEEVAPPLVPPYQSQSIYSEFPEISSSPVKNNFAKKSLTELKRDPEFAKTAVRFMESIGKNENIFEYLRDSDFSLSAAGQRAIAAKSWDKQTAQDYLYLRENFDKAELRGLRERAGFVADLTADIAFDPLNWLAVAFAVPTGGATIAGSQAATQAAKFAVQNGFKKLASSLTSKEAVETGLRTAGLTAAEGAIYTGSHDLALQNIQMSVDPDKKKIDLGQTAAATALGAGIGGVIGGGLGLGFGARHYWNQMNKYSNEDKIIRQVEDLNVEESIKTDQVAHEINKRRANITPEVETDFPTINFDSLKIGDEIKVYDVTGKSYTTKVLSKNKQGRFQVTNEEGEKVSLGFDKSALTQSANNPNLLINLTGEEFEQFNNRTINDLSKRELKRLTKLVNKEVLLGDERLSSLVYRNAAIIQSKRLRKAKTVGQGFFKQSISTILGQKVTTPLARTAETLEYDESLINILELFRHDAFDTFLEKNVTKQRGKTYGENRRFQTSKYMSQLEEALEGLNETGVFNVRLSEEQTLQVVGLVSNPKNVKLLKGLYIPDDKGNPLLKIPPASDEVLKAADIIRNKILKPIWEEGSEQGIWGPLQKVFNYFPRVFNRSKIINNRDSFERLIIKSGHADPINEEQALQNQEIFKRNQKEVVTAEGDRVKGVDVAELTSDENIYGVDFLKAAGGNIDEARKLKVKRIVDDMLNQEDGFETFAANENYSFMKSRVFTKLKDEELAPYLENDLKAILSDYITSTSEAITRSRMGIRTFADFEKNYVNPLRRDLEKSFKIEKLQKEVADAKDPLLKKEATKKLNKANNQMDGIIRQTRDLYSGTTGVRKFTVNKDGGVDYGPQKRTLSEGLRLSQQLAHLGAVTLSSITEPLILLQKVPTTDSPQVINDVLKNAGRLLNSDLAFWDKNSSIRRVIDRAEIKVPRNIEEAKKAIKGLEYDSYTIKKYKPTTKKEKKIYQEEIYKEAYAVGLAYDQALIERLEGMTGEALSNKAIQRISHGFFKFVLLDQWTRATQLAAFTTGKRAIRRNAKKLYEHDKGINKINENEAVYLREQLLELDIDPNKAMDWYGNSLDSTGRFSQTKAQNQDFYAESYLTGAGRFTDEVILQPTASMANKPLWHNSAEGKILFQLAGYPTVFTNTILKRFSNEIIRNGGQATPRTVAAVMAMTGVAYFANLARTGGAYAHEPVEQQVADAVRRWGGAGASDYYFRVQDALKGGKGNLHSIGMAPLGPIAQDVADLYAQRKGLSNILAENTPGYAVFNMFGEGNKEKVRALGREGSKAERELLKKIFLAEEQRKRSRFSRGGLVEGLVDVPNAKDNPADTINKTTGLTYSGKTPVEQQMDDMLEEKTGIKK